MPGRSWWARRTSTSSPGASPARTRTVRRTHEGTYPANAASYSAGVRRKPDDAAGIGHRDYRRAVEELSAVRAAFFAKMAGIDVLITPTLGGPAPRAGCDEAAVRGEVGRITAVVSALGLPALAIGDLQLVGRSESAVLRAGLCREARGGTVPAPR
ncbi:hypothetical protein GCM10023191_048950 [Actinoallomurus oryzae]|uniref:Amidase domain-containing protein n=1 Tax=Actinoallomurus oryzae TaxID=502180 RepID=A0ABP8QBM3_9ACTN